MEYSLSVLAISFPVPYSRPARSSLRFERGVCASGAHADSGKTDRDASQSAAATTTTAAAAAAGSEKESLFVLASGHRRRRCRRWNLRIRKRRLFVVLFSLFFSPWTREVQTRIFVLVTLAEVSQEKPNSRKGEPLKSSLRPSHTRREIRRCRRRPLEEIFRESSSSHISVIAHTRREAASVQRRERAL